MESEVDVGEDEREEVMIKIQCMILSIKTCIKCESSFLNNVIYGECNLLNWYFIQQDLCNVMIQLSLVLLCNHLVLLGKNRL